MGSKKEIFPVLGTALWLGLYPASGIARTLPLAHFITSTSVLIHFLFAHIGSTSSEKQNRLINIIVDKSELFVLVFSSNVCIILAQLNHQFFQAFFKGLDNVDARLQLLGWQDNGHSRRCYHMIGAVVRILCTASMWLFELILLPNELSLLIVPLVYTPVAVRLINEKLFTVLCELLTIRMSRLIMTMSRTPLQSAASKAPPALVLQRHILRLCSSLQQAFAPQILIIIASIFVLVTTNLYMTIKDIQRTKGLSWSSIFFTICWTGLRLFELWSMVSSSTDLQKEVNKFNTRLYKFILEDESNFLILNDKYYLHIVKKQTFEFSVCGFFSLSPTLIHLILASVTTYLVILLQFSPNT